MTTRPDGLVVVEIYGQHDAGHECGAAVASLASDQRCHALALAALGCLRQLDIEVQGCGSAAPEHVLRRIRALLAPIPESTPG